MLTRFYILTKLTISHNPRFRTGTARAVHPRTAFLQAHLPLQPVCIHIAAAPLMTQRPQKEWFTLASSLLVQSNPSSQRMASRVQLWLHYPSNVLLDTRLSWYSGLELLWLAGYSPFFALSSWTTPTGLRQCRSSWLCSHKAGLWSIAAQQRPHTIHVLHQGTIPRTLQLHHHTPSTHPMTSYFLLPANADTVSYDTVSQTLCPWLSMHEIMLELLTCQDQGKPQINLLNQECIWSVSLSQKPPTALDRWWYWAWQLLSRLRWLHQCPLSVEGFSCIALMDCICHMEDHPGISLLMIARGQPTGVPLNADIDFFTLCCNNFLCCINGGDVLSQEGEPLYLVGINPQELLSVSRQICRPILLRLSLVWDFRLFGLYWSQTTGTAILLAWSSWLLT